MENLIIRDIQYEDYYNGYFDLMVESSNDEYSLSDREFRYYLDQMKYNRLSKILVIYSIIENKIIGTGMIFKLNKINKCHICHIEDVIISDIYKDLELDKLLINKLTEIGINEFRCSKINVNVVE
jgi:hypothetical protein